MFYTYVLRSKRDGKLYTGATNNLRKRFVKNRLKRFLSPMGQATLELTVALILISILIVGSVRIFVWLNERMIYRQADYESTRAAAANATTYITDLNDPAQTNGIQIDESAYPELNVFR